MSTTHVVNTFQLQHANQILDLLNGSNQFYIENPFYIPKGVNRIKSEEFFALRETGKGKNSGVVLSSPKIYFKKGDEYITRFYLSLDDGGRGSETKIKMFPPMSNDDGMRKESNKVFVSFGKPEVLSTQALLLLDYQLAQGSNFLILSKLFGLDLSKFKTDEDFLGAVCKRLKISSDTYSDYHKIIKSKAIEIQRVKPKNSKNDKNPMSKTHDVIGIIRKKLDDYLSSDDADEKNNVVVYMRGDAYSTKSCFKAGEYMMGFGDGAKKGVNTSANLTFTLKIGEKDEFMTKICRKGKALSMTYEEYLKMCGKQYNAKLLCSLSFDYRSYGVGIVNTLKITVRQCAFKAAAGNSEAILIDTVDYDDDSEETLIDDEEHVVKKSQSGGSGKRHQSEDDDTW